MSSICCFGSTDKDSSNTKKLQKQHSLKRRKQPTTDAEAGPITFDRDYAYRDLDFSYLTTRDVEDLEARDFDALTLGLNSNDEWEWSGGHRLSAILEILSENSRRDSGSVQDILERYLPPGERLDLPTLNREYERLSRHLKSQQARSMSTSGRSPERQERRRSVNERRSPVAPRPIEAPPRNLEAISQIDASLTFEHFTTEDAWLLGSALRTRLLPNSTPVVISISLANQNQVLFHTVTHSGVMPDNESWVARKRKTVLRWGVSTWYMHCKFDGDEKAFAEKYGLGPDAGSYAIHGGGVPIRVVGVEGVVAVVVVSGLKQHEDHGVIVECIRELYY